MMLPPKEEVPVHIEMLSDSEDWQLGKLENGFLKEIGEEALTKERQELLSQAVRDGKITFFVAKRGYRSVGMMKACIRHLDLMCSLALRLPICHPNLKKDS